MPQAKNQIGCLVRRGTAGGNAASHGVDGCGRFRRACHCKYIMFSEVI